MKRTILSSLGSLLALVALGQGSVTFQNASAIAGWSPVADRNVKFGLSPPYPLLVAGANVSSNYAGMDLSSLRAALYYAPGVVSDSNWQFVNNLAMPTTGGSAFATFKQSTSTTAGSWFGGTRTMAGVPVQGGVVSLMVVVWDASLTADPFSLAAVYGLWGRSSVFKYTTPASSTPAPADFLMNNLASFSIIRLPEPAATALTVPGAALLFLFRRSKKTSAVDAGGR